jgi:hypothetical protein
VVVQQASITDENALPHAAVGSTYATQRLPEAG